MEAAVARLAGTPERGVGPKLAAEPAKRAVDQRLQVGSAQDFAAQANLPEPAADREAAAARGQSRGEAAVR